MRAGLRLIPQNPIFGVGLDSCRNITGKRVPGRLHHPHAFDSDSDRCRPRAAGPRLLPVVDGDAIRNDLARV